MTRGTRVTRDADVLVVGLGGLGSAAAYHLARRGQRVLGLDAFSPGHTRGSSHGESRIIRQAYHEHPDYVPLLRRAYTLWDELQAASGTELLRRCGGIFVGHPESQPVAGALESARRHGVPHELLDAGAVRRRIPVLRPAPHEVGVYEPGAGLLFPERCIEAHVRLAGAAGATLRFEEPVRSWTALGGHGGNGRVGGDDGAGGEAGEDGVDGVEVETATGRYRAARVVVTAGAWLGRLLGDLRLPLRPERNVVLWLQPRETPHLFESHCLPVFLWDTGGWGTGGRGAGPGGVFYGLPHLERPGVKVGLHHSGDWCDPDTVDREVRPDDETPVRAFVARAMPALDGPVAGGAVCLYTNTPDGHFVVDRHPRHPAVVFAGGTSGHGFKLTSVLGEVLADLAIRGETTPDAAFLGTARFLTP